MQKQIITNINCLANVHDKTHVLRGRELSDLPCIYNAYLIIEDGVIAAFGEMKDWETEERSQETKITNYKLQTINASGATLLPCWCDSHTHLVFAASREEELFEKAQQRLNELIKLGTGSIEIKSGYGLTVEGELKILRVIKRLKESSPIPIKATFLGAHAYPEKYKNDHDGYIKIIINEMLPNIAKEGLADFIDVFCEKGFFSADEMIRICEAGYKYGLKPKLHVNQLNSIGGIEAGIKLNAVSMDHLETLTDEEIKMLSGKKPSALGGEVWRGIATLLPTAAFFLRMNFQPARALIDAGCAIALASD